MLLQQDLGSGQFEMFGAVVSSWRRTLQGGGPLTISLPMSVCALLWRRGAHSFILSLTHSFNKYCQTRGPAWLGLWGHAVGQSLSTTDLVVLQRMWVGASCFLERSRPCLQCSPLEPCRAGLAARQRGVQGCLQRPDGVPQVPRPLRGRLKPNLTDG